MTRGERLRKLRDDVDRTLEEVGNAVNISKQNLYKYENDIITNIPSDKIELLAVYYGVTPSYIMGWDNKYIQDQGRVSRNSNVMEKSEPYTIAAHHDGEDWTEEELEDIELFKEALRLKRAKKRKEGE